MNAWAVSVDIAATRAFITAAQWLAAVANACAVRLSLTASFLGNSLWAIRQSV